MRIGSSASAQSGRLIAAAAALWMALGAPPAFARPACAVADSFADFARVADGAVALPEAQQLEVVRRDYLGRHAELYAPEVMPAPSDALVLRTLGTVRAHPEWRAFDAALGPVIAGVADHFAQAFPDFRCDFPIRVTETFGAMDGAGRVVAGRPSLVLGVDTIAHFETKAQLPVFLSHELFHRYHFRAAGFSDDPGERNPIWRALWAEGLATYVSARLNPSNPVSDAFLYPADLEARARPFAPQMAAELLAAADRVDPKTYAQFFEVVGPSSLPAGWPPRSGYYVGYLVAQDLGRRRSLSELAHLKGPALRAEIGRALERLSQGQGGRGAGR